MQPYNKSLHRFSVFAAVCTFFLIIAGGLVTSTGSGLAVPDWPLSYGQLMPPMIGGILYEHSHRMVASFVGLLTVILTVWVWKKETRRWLRVLSLFALLAVIAQGVLGGLTVLFLLPTPISVGHATLAQTFFCIMASIALFTSRWWLSEQPALPDSERKPSVGMLCLAMTFAVYIQLILGALMRHTHSGLAVPDFPLAYGQLFPSLSPESLATYNEQLARLNFRSAAEEAITASQIVTHMLHRLWALVVGVLVVWTFVRVRKLTSMSKRFSILANVILGLLILQFSLGALTVLSRKDVDITTAHVATGALLLVSCLLVTLHVYRLSEYPFIRLSMAGAGREAIA